MSEFVRVLSVTPLDGFKAEFFFTNGVRRIIDLEPYLHGSVFEPIRKDPALFRAMYVDCGTITWPDEIDIDPDVLYYNLTPALPQRRS